MEIIDDRKQQLLTFNWKFGFRRSFCVLLLILIFSLTLILTYNKDNPLVTLPAATAPSSGVCLSVRSQYMCVWCNQDLFSQLHT